MSLVSKAMQRYGFFLNLQMFCGFFFEKMRVFDVKRPFYQLKSAMEGKIFLAIAENNCRNTLQGFFKNIKNFFKKMKNFLKNLLMF